MKGQGSIMAPIIGGISVVILVVIIANVVMPQLKAPTNDYAAATSTGVFSAQGLNITVSGYNNYTTTYLDVTQAGTMALTYAGIAAGKVNVTTPDDGTLITTLDGTSPDTVTLSAANLAKSCSTTHCVFNYTSPSGTGTGQNVTAGTLSYYQQPTATQQGWTASETNIWAILGLFVILGALVFIAFTFIVGATKQ